MARKSNNINERFIVYPLIQLGQEWSIKDELFHAVWNQLEIEHKVVHLFYDGKIKDRFTFVEFLHSPGVFPIVVWDSQEKTVVHIAWLKDAFDFCAWAHHCAVGPYRKGAWEIVKKYWQSIENLKLLLGLTPETNEKAVRFLKICGFNIVGSIPWVCNMAYEGKRVPGVVSYLEL